MGLTNEHVGPKILAKIKIYVLARAELLITLCYEIPCKKKAVYKLEYPIIRDLEAIFLDPYNCK